MYPLFAAFSAFGAIALTALVTAWCPKEHKWIAVIFVPIVVGFVASYVWGRSIRNTNRAMICATATYLAAGVFLAFDLFAIFRIHAYQTALVALTALMSQGLYLTFQAGRVMSTVPPAVTVV